MTKFRALSGRIRIQTTAPTSPKEGEEYFNNTLGYRLRYDGAVWRSVVYTTTSTSISTTTTVSTSTSSTTTSTSTTTTSTSTSISISTTTSTTT